MLFKAAFLVLAVSQALASPSLLPRFLEILQSRQNECPTCVPAANAINCTPSPGCFCNPTIDADVQACVNCTYTNYPTLPSVLGQAQQFADLYNQQCASVAGYQTVTTPFSATYTVASSTPTSSSAGGVATNGPSKSGSTSERKQAGIAVIGAVIGAAVAALAL